MNSIGSSIVMMWAAPAPVHQIDERGERGALAGAGGAGHDDEAAVDVGPGRDDLGQPELVHLGRGRHDPEDERGGAAL